MTSTNAVQVALGWLGQINPRLVVLNLRRKGPHLRGIVHQRSAYDRYVIDLVDNGRLAVCHR